MGAIVTDFQIHYSFIALLRPSSIKVLALEVIFFSRKSPRITGLRRRFFFVRFLQFGTQSKFKLDRDTG